MQVCVKAFDFRLRSHKSQYLEENYKFTNIIKMIGERFLAKSVQTGVVQVCGTEPSC